MSTPGTATHAPGPLKWSRLNLTTIPPGKPHLYSNLIIFWLPSNLSMGFFSLFCSIFEFYMCSAFENCIILMYWIHFLISQRDEEPPLTPSYMSSFPEAGVKTKQLTGWSQEACFSCAWGCKSFTSSLPTLLKGGWEFGAHPRKYWAYLP